MITTFITSHNNTKCLTLEMLLSKNYSGDYYIVIDDTDNCIEEYKQIYGNHLVIFNKEHYMDITDCGHKSDEKPKACVVYARNAIEDKARELNLKHFIMCDDDITNIKIRPIDYENKKIAYAEIDDITVALQYYVDYAIEANIACLGLGTGNSYFGGFASLDGRTTSMRRGVYNLFIRNLDYDWQWCMPTEDVATETKYARMGHLFLSHPGMQLMAKPVGTGKAYKGKQDGMGEFYANTTDYIRAYYSFMINPSGCVVRCVKGKFGMVVKSDNAYPKIIPKIK